MTDTANETLSLEEYREEQAQSMSEAAINRAVVDWADRMHQVGKRPALKMLFHVPNGGKMPQGAAGKLKGMGMREGVPDLWLPVPASSGEITRDYSGLVLELKSADGYLRPEQVWWLHRLVMENYAVAVARSVEEAITTLTDYLGGEHEPAELPLDRAEPPSHAK